MHWTPTELRALSLNEYEALVAWLTAQQQREPTTWE